MLLARYSSLAEVMKETRELENKSELSTYEYFLLVNLRKELEELKK